MLTTGEKFRVFFTLKSILKQSGNTVKLLKDVDGAP